MEDKEDILFEVPGAGQISVSINPHSYTGGAYGFSFGVSWGKYGFAGGVLGLDEARRLAIHILDNCKDLTQSEKELYNIAIKELRKYNEKINAEIVK